MAPARANGSPLADITVIDLSRLFPGGFCSWHFVDLGARVIKVEEPGVGDFYRAQTPAGLLGTGHFAALNRGKESLTLNLKTDRGRAILLRLVESADVVIESFRPGRLKKLGLDYSQLRRHNPRIVLCSLTGYGQTGPAAQEAGHDLNYMSRSALLSLTGKAGKPELIGFQVADMSGGLYGVVAIMAALQQRQRTGKGAWIDLAIAEGCLSLAGVHLTGESWDGVRGLPGQGLLDGGAASYQLYETQDRQPIALAALEPKFWQNFQKAIGRSLGAISGFDSILFTESYKKNLKKIFKGKTLRQWSALARIFDMCLSPVRSLHETLTDAQFRSRRIFMYLTGADRRKIPFVRIPFLFDGKRLGSRRRAPKLGEHTRSILQELGCTGSEIRRLKEEGVIG